jgi:SAM-dependent methyltransferase
MKARHPANRTAYQAAAPASFGTREGPISERRERFQSGTERYAQFRPHYPASLVQFLTQRIATIPAPQDLPVLDVGSGTGIFTRQLRASLPGAIPVIGVEPSALMRARANADERNGSVTYLDGVAERLPVGNASARAVIAATAAHWFDRPAFYLEASRVLAPCGTLAIAEYVRDEAASASARAVVRFLAEYGEPRAYVRPDYPYELNALNGVGPVEMFQQAVTFPLTPDDFVGLALSSSHARHAIEELGLDEADRILKAVGAELADNQGHVPFGYLFQVFVVTRL